MGHRERLLVAASCVVAASAWTTLAHAEDEAAFFTLIVNQIEQGNVFVVLRDGDVLIERAELESAGLSHFTATEVKVGERTLISLDSVQPKVKFDADEETIVLKIDAPTSMLPSHAIDLSSEPEGITYHRRASAFFNYSPSVAVATTGPASLTAFGEVGVSETNRLWYTSVTGGTTSGGVARQLTNVTVDNRPAMTHLIVGDANVSTGSLGGASVVEGVTYARDFSLNPYFVRFPSMRFASATDVPAQVDVYVNGIRTKSIPLNPGTFTLDNLKGLTGGGTVRYVLRDALGGTQSFTSPYYVAASVLKQGLEDFAFSAGLPRDNTGVPDNLRDALGDYELPAFLGYYRRGVTDWLTLGVRAEGQWGTVFSGGPDIATTTSAGVFELELGASAGGSELRESGAAGTFSYQYLSRRLSVSGSIRVLTPQYSYVQLSPAQDRALYLANAGLSVPITGGASVTSLFSLGVNRDELATASVGLFTSFSPTRSITLSAQASFGTEAFPTPEASGIVSIAWSLPQSVYVGAGASMNNNVPGANLQMSKSSGFGEAWGMSAAANITDTSVDVSVSHRLQTSTNVIQTFLDWTGSTGNLSISPAGGIVWVAGHGLFLTRPLVDAFGLVRVPNLKDVRVYANSQEVGRTNANGEFLVPTMLSYYGSQLRIASQDVPLSYVLDRDVMTLAPPRRGCAYAEFLAVRSHYFRGKVSVVRNGKEEVPSFGDLAVNDHGTERVSPLGEDGGFELEGMSAGVHEAEIRHRHGICKFKLDAKETSDALLIDLGPLRCTVGAAASP